MAGVLRARAASMIVQSPTSPGRAGTLPQIFGRYLLLQRISRGGMGEIFLARHGLSGFEKLVVIKKVLPNLAADQEFLTRFVDEAQVAVKLQHANIAQVFEVGRVGDEYFLAMEHVDGRDLRRTLTQLGDGGRRMPPDLALMVGRDVANGLAYAHRRTGPNGESLELVHCDVSPPNVLMSFEGEVKLIDFGIAKSALQVTGTDPKRGFGKFGYMSPEQLIRGARVDYRADIYALGVILYEMLAGERLYSVGDTPDYRALARMVARGQHPLPSDVDSSLARYDDLIRRALRPDPDDRYQTAAEFRDLIQEALVEIHPTVSPDQLGAFMRSLFAEDVAEQKRQLEEVDLTDLDQWRDKLGEAESSTVSFALAELPLVAPPPTELVPRASPASPPPPRRRQGWIIAGAAAAGMAVAGVAVALATGGSSAPAEEAAASEGGTAGDEASPATGHPTVEPLPPEEAEIEPEPGAEADSPPPGEAEQRARPERRPPRRPREPELTVRGVQKRFQAVSREYERFKRRYGSRLEEAWNDLATFATYHGKRPEKLKDFDRRIRRFRSRMRRARAGP